MCRKILTAAFFVMMFGTAYRGYSQQIPSFSIQPMGAQPIAVATNRITNLIFPTPLGAGIKVSGDIMVQRVKGAENALELKAMRKGFEPTSVSVFSTGGRLYSFLVEFNESAKNFDFIVRDEKPTTKPENSVGKIILTGMQFPAEELAVAADSIANIGFLHRSKQREKLRLYLHGIYLKDSMLWVGLELRNSSQIPYKVDYLRVYSAGKSKVKRAADHENDFEPAYLKYLPLIAGKQAQRFAVAYRPFTLAPDQWLFIEVGEQGGGRTVKLRVSGFTLLRARD